MILKINIMADVTSEPAISRITRISLSLAPNLFSRLRRSRPKAAGPAGVKQGAKWRSGAVDYRTSDRGHPWKTNAAQPLADSFRVRQSRRILAAKWRRLRQKAFWYSSPGGGIGADSLWMLHQRQKSMGGCAGDDLQNTVVLESSKRSDGSHFRRSA